MAEPHFAVIVRFDIAAAARGDFLSLVRANAATSLAEAGCRRFDIVEAADAVWLYEIYDDGAAFKTHLETAHFREFDKATRTIVRTKSVETGPVSESAHS
jgi:quinol monooxygenase YgiN